MNNTETATIYSARPTQPGCFVVLEGIDGAGTSTQTQLLHVRLQQENIPAAVSCEPSKGPVGALIRQGLQKRVQFDERTLALLFAADRVDHLYNVHDGVFKHCQQGMVEISDRYVWSSLAYQGVSLPPEWIKEINRLAVEPDLLVFLDISPADALRRVRKKQAELELYDDRAYLEHVARNYRRLVQEAWADPQSHSRVIVLDALKPREELAETIWAEVHGLVKKINLF